MIILSFALFGALLGALNARRQGGKPADLAQYAAAMAIAMGLLGLLVTIAVSRF